jgi:hypothetical protein
LVLQEKGRIELPHLLYASRLGGVTFPPDRVFSIYPLSLIGSEPTDAEADMLVDYSLSHERVFMNCSKYLLRKYRNLNIFSYVTSYYEGSYYNLPSWASTFMFPTAIRTSSKSLAPAIRRSDFDDTLPISWTGISLSSPDSYQRLVKGKFQPLDGDDIYEACGDKKSTDITFKVEPEYPVGASWELRGLWELEHQLSYLVLEGILVDRITWTKDISSGFSAMDTIRYHASKCTANGISTETF